MVQRIKGVSIPTDTLERPGLTVGSEVDIEVDESLPKISARLQKGVIQQNGRS